MNRELYHHGVKGMHWGVRKDRSSGGVNSSTRKNNSDYILGGRVKKSTAKKVAVGTGAALVAAGSIYAAKYLRMNADHVIKAGKHFQHLSRYDDATSTSRPFYASYIKRDNKNYAKGGFFGANWNYKHELVSDRDIKIAGKKTSEKTFKDWLSKSETAKEYDLFKGLDINDKKAMRRAYTIFNKELKSPDMRYTKIRDDYFRELSRKGYHGVRDRNDQINSGMISPIFMFSNLDNIRTVKVSSIKKG